MWMTPTMIDVFILKEFRNETEVVLSWKAQSKLKPHWQDSLLRTGVTRELTVSVSLDSVTTVFDCDGKGQEVVVHETRVDCKEAHHQQKDANRAHSIY